MIILAVDLGKARTGIAVCDRLEILASPVCTITETSTNKLIIDVADKARELKAEHIVVGLPKNMDGTEGDSAKSCREFAKSLEEKSGLPVTLWDERLTTKSAAIFLNSTDTRGKKRKQVIDSLSASIILEGYLSSRKRDSL